MEAGHQNQSLERERTKNMDGNAVIRKAVQSYRDENIREALESMYSREFIAQIRRLTELNPTDPAFEEGCRKALDILSAGMTLRNI